MHKSIIHINIIFQLYNIYMSFCSAAILVNRFYAEQIKIDGWRLELIEIENDITQSFVCVRNKKETHIYEQFKFNDLTLVKILNILVKLMST